MGDGFKAGDRLFLWRKVGLMGSGAASVECRVEVRDFHFKEGNEGIESVNCTIFLRMTKSLNDLNYVK